MTVLGIGGIVAAVVGIAGCSSGIPQAVSSTETSVETDTVATTMTATVTDIVTTTATATLTVVDTTVDAPGSSVSTAPVPSVDSGPGTDKESVLLHADRVVRDVQTADERIASGFYSGLYRTMLFLKKDFSDLQSDGAPPGSDATQYLANCGTESQFADLASQEFSAGNDTDAIARYTVMRQHVNEVLSAINTAYGGQYSV